MKHFLAGVAAVLFIASITVCGLRLAGHTDTIFKTCAHLYVAGLLGAGIVAATTWATLVNLVECADPVDRWTLPELRRLVSLWRVWTCYLMMLSASLILTECLAAAGVL